MRFVFLQELPFSLWVHVNEEEMSPLEYYAAFFVFIIENGTPLLHIISQWLFVDDYKELGSFLAHLDHSPLIKLNTPHVQTIVGKYSMKDYLGRG